MTSLRRAADRYHSTSPGVQTWHCFSAGAHYDPDRLGVGALVGVDEHLVAPEAGFGWHAHRGVHIASWVLEGALRHEDSGGEVRIVGPGTFLLQSAGGGIRHCETNASHTAPLRFLQLTVLGDEAVPVRLAAPPIQVGVASVELHPGRDGLAVGDFSVDGDRFALALGTDELLVVWVEE